MKSTFPVFLITLIPICCLAQLPEDTGSILKKLQEWEFQQRIEVEEAIREKRGDVLEILETHLERVTKSGDFDNAILIKKEIERLQESIKTGGVAEQSLLGSTNAFIGQTYVRQSLVKGSDPIHILFKEGGRAIVGGRSVKWRRLESGVVVISAKNMTDRFWAFAADAESAVVRIGADGSPIEAKKLNEKER